MKKITPYEVILAASVFGASTLRDCSSSEKYKQIFALATRLGGNDGEGWGTNCGSYNEDSENSSGGCAGCGGG